MKKKKVAKPKRELTTAEAFYVESHFGKKPAEAIAKEIGVPTKLVADYIGGLEEAGVKPQASPTKAQSAGFETRSGATSMTGTSSAAEVKPADNEFFKRRVPGLHIIDASQPVG